jgi:hypothetical protein
MSLNLGYLCSSPPHGYSEVIGKNKELSNFARSFSLTRHERLPHERFALTMEQIRWRNPFSDAGCNCGLPKSSYKATDHFDDWVTEYV